jgi:hypothetical protein
MLDKSDRQALELLAAAILHFLESPESEEKFSGLDWLLHTTAAKWSEYALTRRVAASRAMLHPSGEGDR